MSLIPQAFDINGKVTIRFEQESLIMLGAVILIVIIVALIAYYFIAKRAA